MFLWVDGSEIVNAAEAAYSAVVGVPGDGT